MAHSEAVIWNTFGVLIAPTTGSPMAETVSPPSKFQPNLRQRPEKLTGQFPPSPMPAVALNNDFISTVPAPFGTQPQHQQHYSASVQRHNYRAERISAYKFSSRTGSNNQKQRGFVGTDANQSCDRPVRMHPYSSTTAACRQTTADEASAGQGASSGAMRVRNLVSAVGQEEQMTPVPRTSIAFLLS